MNNGGLFYILFLAVLFISLNKSSAIIKKSEAPTEIPYTERVYEKNHLTTYIPIEIENDGEYVKIAKVDKTITMRVTAYAPHDNQSGICAENTAYPVTSRGEAPNREIVAVDPDKIPYGTVLYIPDYGVVVAGDTGGTLREYDGYALDVYMPTYKEAIEWGVRYLDVYIINE